LITETCKEKTNPETMLWLYIAEKYALLNLRQYRINQVKNAHKDKFSTENRKL